MSVLDEPLRFGRDAAPARVTLVGAGPGDPELLTLKAARVLARATLVLHDQLVSDEVLALLPAHAERIDVGKRCGAHAMSQRQICALMVELARAGRPLVRLKGGDPFIFGRGGEECEALAAAGVPFEVVPGITAAQGAAAALHMPLTHRDHADAVIYVTGHRRGDAAALNLDWPRLARPHQTVVVYMGLASLGPLCASLMAHGLAPDTPAATVENATRPSQRVLVADLASLPARAAALGVQPPALVVIGGVARLPALLRVADGAHAALA